MEWITVIAYVLFMIMFITSIVISLRFQFGSEGKDERGQKIINTAYSVAFPIIPIGWLLITLYDDFIQSVGYSAYKWLIRSEERRVGKEVRSRWGRYGDRDKVTE